MTSVHPTLGLLLITVLVTLSACSDGPREVHIGTEECAHCRMMVSEEQFASQLMTDRGRHYVFDSIECMAEFLDHSEEVPEDRIQELWVSDFPDPGNWIPVAEAYFLRSDELRSPMGLYLSAYADLQGAQEAQTAFGGEILNWAEVRALVQETSVVGEPGHSAHSQGESTPREAMHDGH